jgi:four helix bundle protein
MGNHRDLQVWQRAREFAAKIDQETRQLGRGHGELADQLRRAALSIPTNLAEGASKGRDPEFLRFINIAIGSAAECDSLLAHAELVAALDPGKMGELGDELTVIRKMLFRLRGALQARAGLPQGRSPEAGKSSNPIESSRANDQRPKTTALEP